MLSLLLLGQVHVDTVVRLPFGCGELMYLESPGQLLVISAAHETLYVLNCVDFAVDKALPLHGDGATSAYGVWNWKRNKFYVTLAVPETLFVYDPALESITAWLPFKDIRSPCYVSTHDWVYAVDERRMQMKVIDCVTDSVIRVMPQVPYGVSGAVAWDSVGDKVYAMAYGAPREDVLLAYSCANDSPVAAVHTGIFCPRVLAFCPPLRKAYLGRDWGGATDSSVAVYDCERDTVTRRLPIAYPAFRNAVYNPKRVRVYIPGNGNYQDTVFAVDCASDSITGRITLPLEVGNMTIATGTDRLYVCCPYPTDRVIVVDCATDSVIASIAVGRGPMFAVYDSTHDRVFVACQDSTIWVLADDSSGIAETQADRPVPTLQAQPNPLTDRALIRLDVKPASPVVIYDAVGRRVRSLAAGPDGRDVTWDARDQSGRRVRAGVYYASVLDAGTWTRVQLLVVR